jgi:hypothetical protein
MIFSCPSTELCKMCLCTEVVTERNCRLLDRSHVLSPQFIELPVTVAARSKALHVGFEVFTAVVLKSIFFWDMTTQRTTRRHIPEEDTFKPLHVFARPNTGIMGFFLVCVVLCKQRPCNRADHPSRESYRLSIRSIVLD